MGKSNQTKSDRKKEIVKALCYDVTIDKAREIKKGNQGGYMPVLLAWLDVLRNMKLEEVGKWVISGLAYHVDGTEPEFDSGKEPMLYMMWAMSKPTWDNYLTKYVQRCETNWKNKIADEIYKEEQEGYSQQEIMERHPEYKPIVTNGHESTPVDTNRNQIGVGVGTGIGIGIREGLELGEGEEKGLGSSSRTTTGGALPRSSETFSIEDEVRKRLGPDDGTIEQIMVKLESYLRVGLTEQRMKEIISRIPVAEQRKGTFMDMFTGLWSAQYPT
jgi:hypothetical protein